jgi:hypothetical protein
MTEADWLGCAAIENMLGKVRGPSSGRKFRLFAVACCRRIEQWADKKYRVALEVAEIFADEPTRGTYRAMTYERLSQALKRFSPWGGMEWHANRAYSYSLHDLPSEAAQVCASDLMTVMCNVPGTKGAADRMNRAQQEIFAVERKLLRDIFGNPFRPVTIDPGWLTANVVLLAQAIYDERTYDRMPILGDALEDAGCDNANMLNHCREPGGHVRGCWVVDLLLERK